MADYQSLLTRAVANLPPSSTPAARQAIYDRARKALVDSTAIAAPAVAGKRHRARGDGARQGHRGGRGEIRCNRRSAGGRAAGRGSRAAEPSAAACANGSTASRRCATRGHGRKASGRPFAFGADASARREPQPAAAGGAVVGSSARVPSHPGSPFRSGCAFTSGSAADIGATRGSGAYGEILKPPPVQVGSPSANGADAPPVTAAQEADDAPASADLGAVVPSHQAGAVVAPGAPPIVAGRADDDDESLAVAPEVPLDGERVGLGASGGGRVAACRALGSGRERAIMVMGGARAGSRNRAVGRHRRHSHASEASGSGDQSPLGAGAGSRPGSGKDRPARAIVAGRGRPRPVAVDADGEPAADGATPAEGAAPANTPQGTQTETQLPSAARAAMLIASADNPQKPVVNLGSTVWSTIPAPQGQPSGVAVEADADIPDLKMHASMILRKNGDPTLQATHTIDLKFTFQDGAPFNGFKDVGLPQMRKLDSTASEALSSVKVKISDDYFLFALAKGDQDSARNLDLIQTRAWFDFPLLLNDNRIAKLVFQKSSEGEAMLEKALDAWK